MIRFWCFFLSFSFSFFSTRAFVICCLTNKEISSSHVNSLSEIAVASVIDRGPTVAITSNRRRRNPVDSNHTTTRFSIQTAGLAFCGTGLRSYRVRGVDGICAEHLTVESYTVFICQQSYLLLFGIPSPTHSFIPGLKPSFSANPSHCSPSFLQLKYLLRGFPGLFTVISEHSLSVFYF